MYKGGYTGKILRINLTNRSSRIETLPLETARDFIGGAGFGIKYLYDGVKADADALGAERSGPLSPCRRAGLVTPDAHTPVPCGNTGTAAPTGTDSCRMLGTDIILRSIFCLNISSLSSKF